MTAYVTDDTCCIAIAGIRAAERVDTTLSFQKPHQIRVVYKNGTERFDYLDKAARDATWERLRAAIEERNQPRSVAASSDVAGRREETEG